MYADQDPNVLIPVLMIMGLISGTIWLIQKACEAVKAKQLDRKFPKQA